MRPPLLDSLMSVFCIVGVLTLIQMFIVLPQVIDRTGIVVKCEPTHFNCMFQTSYPPMCSYPYDDKITADMCSPFASLCTGYQDSCEPLKPISHTFFTSVSDLEVLRWLLGFLMACVVVLMWLEQTYRQ